MAIHFEEALLPTIAEDGEFRFVVYPNDHPPPHVHVKFGGSEVRINLDSGTFMEEPPGGKRRALLEAYQRHAVAIRKAWDSYHGGGE